MRRAVAPYLALVVLGIGWGLTQPLAKIAVGGGYRPFGLIFWQVALGALLLAVILRLRGLRWPRGRREWALSAAVGFSGTVLPNTASYAATAHLPAGVMSIVISMVPMLAFPIAMGFGQDRFSLTRLAGLVCGLVGVALIALPEGSLPDAGMAAWLPVALIAPAFYGLEANIVGRWGTLGPGPMQLLFGALFVATLATLPLAALSGQWITLAPPWHAPEQAIVLLAAINALVYTGYVALVGRAGPVFAAQVAYLVTAAGVLWAMLLLGEGYSLWVWAAFAAMLVGLALVRPRDAAAQNDACAAQPICDPAKVQT